MRSIYYILLTILLSSCNYHHGYIDGDVKIFKGSKVFDLAKWVKIGYVPKIESILENQELDINELSPIGRWSVLDLAVFDNSPRVVACLMKYGADPFLETGRSSPLCNVIQNCRVECLSEMIEYGRFDTIPENMAIMALFWAYSNCKGNAGNSIPARMAIMAMTTNSSINVKRAIRFMILFLSLYCKFFTSL